MRPLYYRLIAGVLYLTSMPLLQAQQGLTQLFEGQDTFYILPVDYNHQQFQQPLQGLDLPDGLYREYLYADHESDVAEPAPESYFEFKLQNGLLHDTLRHYSAQRHLLTSGEYRHGQRNGYWYEYLDTTSQLSQQTYYEDGRITQMTFYAPEGYPVRRDIHFYDLESTGKVLSTWFHPNGRLARQGVTVTHLKGKRLAQKEGQWRTWHLNGELRAVEYYEAGAYTGECKYFHADGSPDRIATYKRGKLKNEVIYEYAEEFTTAIQTLHRDGKGKVIRVVAL